MIPNSLVSVADIYGINLLTRLRVILVNISLDNFQDTINPLCSCNLEIESTSLFYLRYRNFITPRTNLVSELHKLYSNSLNLDEISLTKLLWYGDSKYENEIKKKDIISLYKFRTLYKPIWSSTNVTFFFDICLLAVFLSFYLCIFYALRFSILCLVTCT